MGVSFSWATMADACTSSSRAEGTRVHSRLERKKSGPLHLPPTFVGKIKEAVRGHASLTLTGDVALDYEFSPLVAFSCVAYSLVGIVYWFAQWWLFGSFYFIVSYFSLYADSLQPNNSFYNMADRVCATLGVLFFPIRVTFGNCGWEVRIAVAAMFLFCFGVLTWSRQSKNQTQFIYRHTAWHLISIAALAWLAFRETSGTLNESVLDKLLVEGKL